MENLYDILNDESPCEYCEDVAVNCGLTCDKVNNEDEDEDE